jgi:Asp-tRNA(Asn)/Glu-tRNA(Gln) amidotransferase A subunit family amidase
VDWVESGGKSPDELLDLCLRRIAAADSEIRAWVQVAPQAGLRRGPLRGIPFGAKDIIETRGMATEYGSALLAGRQGTHDAAVIGALRGQGAVLLGKTHTTVFASLDPAPTRNPRLMGHTPGGSSSGSAAAVAAGMAPFALGTQTLGSVLRPASYCGICGFKPTFGRISMEGVRPFAPSLDTLGLFTETADDMACLWSRSFGTDASGAQLPPLGRIGELPDTGLPAVPLRAPEGWDELTAAARLINAYEGARTHGELLARHGDAVGAMLAGLLRRGLAIPEEEYAAARRHVEQMRGVMARLFDEYPLLLSAAAAGPAPAGLESTGDPSRNAPWTALGVPVISVPLPTDGAPLGLQIAAAWGRDDELVAAAAELERVLRKVAGQALS